MASEFGSEVEVFVASVESGGVSDFIVQLSWF